MTRGVRARPAVRTWGPRTDSVGTALRISKGDFFSWGCAYEPTVVCIQCNRVAGLANSRPPLVNARIRLPRHHPHSTMNLEVMVHVGKRCIDCGMTPILGTCHGRRAGTSWDLCQRCFLLMPEDHKEQFKPFVGSAPARLEARNITPGSRQPEPLALANSDVSAELAAHGGRLPFGCSLRQGGLQRRRRDRDEPRRIPGAPAPGPLSPAYLSCCVRRR